MAHRQHHHISTRTRPSPTPTLPTIRSSTQSKSKSLDEKNASERQRNCLILIHAFLLEHGYVQTSATLQNEAGRSMMAKFECADNVDLPLILAEYEEFYQLKYGRKPKLSRRAMTTTTTSPSGASNGSALQKSRVSSTRPSTAAVCGNSPSLLGSSRVKRRGRRSAPRSTNNAIGSEKAKHLNLLPQMKSNSEDSTMTTCLGSLLRQSASTSSLDMANVNLNGMGEAACHGNTTESSDNNNISNSQQAMDERVLKPLPTFHDPEIHNLASTIRGEILEKSPNVTWDDIIGLDDAKRLLKEAVVLPMEYPELFTGMLSSSWRGALLFGEPGNGKTILAKAVATEANTTFFNISASSIVSKYRGDSEKLIKVTFDLARYYAPSTIFLDEIDAIMSQRGGSGQCSSKGGSGGSGMGGGRGAVMEHEGSRRMKTELLVEMDGVGKGDQHVFVLAASNLPWDLDPALLRRLEKRIMIPMPGKDARRAMLLRHLSQHNHDLSEEDLDQCAGDATEGYSGADIKLLCKEAAMAPVRRIIASRPPPASKGAKGSSRSHRIQRLLEQDPITMADLQSSLEVTKSSTCTQRSKQYMEWAKTHGSM